MIAWLRSLFVPKLPPGSWQYDHEEDCVVMRSYGVEPSLAAAVMLDRERELARDAIRREVADELQASREYTAHVQTIASKAAGAALAKEEWGCPSCQCKSCRKVQAKWQAELDA